MHGLGISRKGGTGGDGWCHPHGDMHMVAARLGCENHVGPSCPDCMDRLRKHYSRLVGGWFLTRKAAWALSRCIVFGSTSLWMAMHLEKSVLNMINDTMS